MIIEENKMAMDMKESFKYRYGVEWDDLDNPNVKFLWVMVWEHAKDYYTREKQNEDNRNVS